MIDSSRDRDSLNSTWWAAMVPDVRYAVHEYTVTVHADATCPDLHTGRAVVRGAADLPGAFPLLGCKACQTVTTVTYLNALAGWVRELDGNLYGLRSRTSSAGRLLSEQRMELDAAWVAAGRFLGGDLRALCTACLFGWDQEARAGSVTQPGLVELCHTWAMGRIREVLTARVDLVDDRERPHLVLCDSSAIRPDRRGAWDGDLASQSPLGVLYGTDDEPLFLVRASSAGLGDLDRITDRRIGCWYVPIGAAAAGHLASQLIRQVVQTMLPRMLPPRRGSIDGIVETAAMVLSEPPGLAERG